MWKRRVLVDMGTSILLEAHVRSDFTAESALETVAQTLQSQGVPEQITLDRDLGFVGSAQGSDFPSARLALLRLPGSAGAGL
jgi:hypothetical protein